MLEQVHRKPPSLENHPVIKGNSETYKIPSQDCVYSLYLQEVFPLKNRVFFTGLDKKNVLNTPLNYVSSRLEWTKCGSKSCINRGGNTKLNNPHWYFAWMTKIQGGMFSTIFN